MNESSPNKYMTTGNTVKMQNTLQEVIRELVK